MSPLSLGGPDSNSAHPPGFAYRSGLVSEITAKRDVNRYFILLNDRSVHTAALKADGKEDFGSS